ncbi:MAG: DUF4982 domain-containing protein [Bacteroidales bacterium]|nr:DUF4982 domain-containing protein [Bacteroidales bacterium]
MTLKHRLLPLVLLLVPLAVFSRERGNFDAGWEFAFGDASSPALDFGCGTEYFNYLTKAASIHNAGPYSPDFDKSKWDREWKPVTLPHDWVVDLPFQSAASHSHGYKTVGFAYPQTSVGWYRKVFDLPAEDDGKHISLQFDGIFRNADIWVNGFWLGKEPSGYATQVYDISEYLNYGGSNVVAVRVDASLEEGWFYEGAGIYRHVWLEKTAPLHVAPFGTFVRAALEAPYAQAAITIDATVRNSGVAAASCSLRHTLLDAEGRAVAGASVQAAEVLAKADAPSSSTFILENPRLWSPSDPYLYTVRTELLQGGAVVDSYDTVIGLRNAVFDPDRGFLLNGNCLEIRGVNQHQDHPGVGTAIPDALQEWRLRELRKTGVNAIRTSHNPATPELLDACDRLGILVLEENRLTGVNQEHRRLLRRMIERDRNHPCIVLWSVGNEEWALEWNDKGRRIAESMREFCHRLDPTRQVTVATSSGPDILEGADVAGYNYLMQNDIDGQRARYPQRPAVGTEETTGCGTRGVYYDDAASGRMASLNRTPDQRDGCLNMIGRGLKFYRARPWLAGLFFWTGFDYRGESNPLVFPATGSEFGLLDYCGFPKDEAWYLKAWWTDEPVLHILPHWNLGGHEGETVSIWVYSNCDEVALRVNGKSLGRKKMQWGGYLSWDAVYKPGKVVATGYRNGRKVMTQVLETTGDASGLKVDADRTELSADGRDVAVCTLRLVDSKGRFVPDACLDLQLTVSGPVRILGVGNGDPAWQAPERPQDPEARTFSVRSFNGLAQVLLQSCTEPGSASLTVSAPEAGTTSLSLKVSRKIVTFTEQSNTTRK